MATKWIKRGLSIGFITFLAGVGLMAAGAAAGGIDQLKAAHAPTLIEKSYGDVSELEVNIYDKFVMVEPSPDDKVHVRYYQSKFLGEGVTLHQKDQHLAVFSDFNTTMVTSPLVLVGEGLNAANGEYNQLTIQLPKDEVFNSLVMTSSSPLTEIRGGQFKVLDLQGMVRLEGVTAESGQLINNYGSIDVLDSQLANTTFVGKYGGTFFIKNSRLTDSQIQLFTANLTVDGGEFQGKVAVENLSGDVRLDLTKETLAKTSISAQKGEINPPEHMEYNEGDVVYDQKGQVIVGGETAITLSIHGDIAKSGTLKDKESFERPVKDSKNSLVITMDGHSLLELTPKAVTAP